jgi:hypothetical protein
MGWFVLVYVPDETVAGGIVSQPSEKAKPAKQPREEAVEKSSERTEDAEQLPLWRWFTF